MTAWRGASASESSGSTACDGENQMALDRGQALEAHRARTHVSDAKLLKYLHFGRE